MVNRKQTCYRNPCKIALKEALACFSEEERKLLREWQNELYKNVMNEIQQVLVSLGPVIAACIFSLRMGENEDLCHVDIKGPARGNSDHHLLSAAISNEYMFSKITKEPEESLHTERIESSNLKPGRDYTEIQQKNSLKVEKAIVSTGDKDLEEIQNTGYPTGFPSFVHESEESCVDLIDGEDEEGGSCRASPGPDAQMIATAGTMKQEAPIKQEVTESMTIFDHEENPNILSSAGFSSFTSEPEVCCFVITDEGGSEHWASGISESEGPKMQLPPSFKEEQVTDCTSHLDSTEQNYISYPTGFPSVTSESGVSSVDPIDGGRRRRGGGGGSRASPNYYTESRVLTVESHMSPEGMNFAQKYSLEQQQRTRTTKKLFPCTECKTIFNRKTRLMEHQRVHQGQKSCTKEYTKHSHLQPHLQSHTRVERFNCTECEKSFSRKYSLSEHMRTHTGMAPFQCMACAASFTWRSSFMRHLRCHAIDANLLQKF